MRGVRTGIPFNDGCAKPFYHTVCFCIDNINEYSVIKQKKYPCVGINSVAFSGISETRAGSREERLIKVSV